MRPPGSLSARLPAPPDALSTPGRQLGEESTTCARAMARRSGLEPDQVVHRRVVGARTRPQVDVPPPPRDQDERWDALGARVRAPRASHAAPRRQPIDLCFDVSPSIVTRCAPEARTVYLRDARTTHAPDGVEVGGRGDHARARRGQTLDLPRKRSGAARARAKAILGA